MATKLGKYFTLEELTVSSSCPDLVSANIKEAKTHKRSGIYLVQEILDPIRAAIGTSVYVSSGFRGTEINSKIGGSSNSQHCKFQAADINAKGFQSDEGRLILLGIIWGLALAGKLRFGQLLIERGCIHISNPRNPSRDGEVAYYDVATKTKRVIQHGGGWA